MIKMTNISFTALAFVATAFLLGSTAYAQAPAAAPKTPAPLVGTWTVDAAHSSIGFTIEHFGISSVPGRFDQFSGTIVADPAHLDKSSVDFTIQVGSVNTNQSYRDNDIKGKSYFDVADYPTATFESTKISKAGHGSYIAVGNFTLHGITRQISLPFTLVGPILDPFGGSRIGIETHALISRVDYGVGGNDQLSDGSFAIGKDVTITISLEAQPAKAS